MSCFGAYPVSTAASRRPSLQRPSSCISPAGLVARTCSRSVFQLSLAAAALPRYTRTSWPTAKTVTGPHGQLRHLDGAARGDRLTRAGVELVRLHKLGFVSLR
jgi:hypothetical protein